MYWKSIAGALLVCAVVSESPADAQFLIDHEQSGYRLRGLHAPSGSPIKRSFESDKEAAAVFRKILSATGIPGVAERISVRASADTSNAEAQIGENGQRFIFYNVTFMRDLEARAGNYWSLVFVVAHEVGHHIAGHLDFRGQNHQVELEADRYAGFILGRMGTSYEQTLSAVRVIAGVNESTTHPPQQQRIQAVALGWSDGRNPAGEGIGDQKDKPSTTTTQQPTTSESPLKKTTSKASCAETAKKYEAAVVRLGPVGTLNRH